MMNCLFKVGMLMKNYIWPKFGCYSRQAVKFHSPDSSLLNSCRQFPAKFVVVDLGFETALLNYPGGYIEFEIQIHKGIFISFAYS